MSREQWSRIDEFNAELLHAEDPVLEAAREAGREAGLRTIEVSASLGKMLMLLVQAMGARRILEIGTLGGYSALWMARGLDMTGGKGSIITLEKDPQTAFIAKRTIMKAKADHLIAVRVGAAADSLRRMAEDDTEPFDLIFIDADRENLPVYLALIMRLVHPGTMIMADNMVRYGYVADPSETNPQLEGVRTFLDLAGKDPRLECTVIQTVSGKGHDGFAMCVVR